MFAMEETVACNVLYALDLGGDSIIHNDNADRRLVLDRHVGDR